MYKQNKRYIQIYKLEKNIYDNYNIYPYLHVKSVFLKWKLILYFTFYKNSSTVLYSQIRSNNKRVFLISATVFCVNNKYLFDIKGSRSRLFKCQSQCIHMSLKGFFPRVHMDSLCIEIRAVKSQNNILNKLWCPSYDSDLIFFHFNSLTNNDINLPFL